MSIDYEKLLIENRKSFREALRRQRKANKLLHEEIERLKSLSPNNVVEEGEQREEKQTHEMYEETEIIFLPVHEKPFSITDYQQEIAISSAEAKRMAEFILKHV